MISMSIHSVTVEGVELAFAGEPSPSSYVATIPVTWAELRIAAGQDDETIAQYYRRLLDAVREIAATITDAHGCHITGTVYEWQDRNSEPHSAIVADGLEQPPIPMRRVTRKRPADPDEVALARRHNEWRPSA